jgi:hypothetical protein
MDWEPCFGEEDGNMLVEWPEGLDDSDLWFWEDRGRRCERLGSDGLN